MNPHITTWALESFRDTINAHGVHTCEIITNVIIGDTHYSEIIIRPNRPIDFIKINYTIENNEIKFGE